MFHFRRLDPSERPLQILYDYLTTMGYADPVRVQQEAANADLSCLIRFYSGESRCMFLLLGARCTWVFGSLGGCSDPKAPMELAPMQQVTCPKSLLSNAACRILISDYRPEANQTHRVQWLSDLKLSLTAARRS